MFRQELVSAGIWGILNFAGQSDNDWEIEKSPHDYFLDAYVINYSPTTTSLKISTFTSRSDDVRVIGFFKTRLPLCQPAPVV